MQNMKQMAAVASLALLAGGCTSSTAPAQTSTVTDTGATSAAHRPAGTRGDPLSTAVLEDTYWKLVRLGATPVTAADQQREPHLVLQPQDGRVVGSGGCNRMAGSYTLAGDKLTFSQMAGTRMACPDGMDVERAFHAALGEVASWRINGGMLELLDAAGVSIAQFESRQLD